MNQEPNVECLSELPLNSVMSSLPFSSVCTTARLRLHLGHARRILLGDLSITVISRLIRGKGKNESLVLEGESGVRGRLALSSEAGELSVEGVEGVAIGKVMAI